MNLERLKQSSAAVSRAEEVVRTSKQQIELSKQLFEEMKRDKGGWSPIKKSEKKKKASPRLDLAG